MCAAECSRKVRIRTNTRQEERIEVEEHGKYSQKLGRVRLRKGKPLWNTRELPGGMRMQRITRTRILIAPNPVGGPVKRGSLTVKSMCEGVRQKTFEKKRWDHTNNKVGASLGKDLWNQFEKKCVRWSLSWNSPCRFYFSKTFESNRKFLLSGENRCLPTKERRIWWNSGFLKDISRTVTQF